MTQYAILTDLNRCVGCLACSAACKTANNVPIGDFWIKVLRIGPNKVDKDESKRPATETYFLPVQCQHCEDPECVKVCPTGASHKLEDGTVQVDKEKCIGCQFCAMSCPYNVRYLNETERVVEKCTLCEQKISQGELPQCVQQCGGRARWFGDLDGDIGDFEGPADPKSFNFDSNGYEEVRTKRVKLRDYVENWDEKDVHHLVDAGNKPAMRYILRGRTWQGKE